MIDTITDVLDLFLGKQDNPSSFWWKAGKGYRELVSRVATLPATDPFWDRRPRGGTEKNLAEYLDIIVSQYPEDVGVNWSVIGWDVKCCSNSLTESSWRLLHRLGELSPASLVDYAWWVRAISGKNTAPILGDLLKRNGLAGAAVSRILEYEGTELRDWAAEVRQAIE